MGGKMLQEVRQNLSDVVHVCEGKKKQTNYLRTLISDLVKGFKMNLISFLFWPIFSNLDVVFYFIFFTLSSGILPRSWCRYTVPTSMTVIQWVADFSERIKQLQQISQAAASGGAKELKVLIACKIKWNTFSVLIFFHFCLIFQNVSLCPPFIEHPRVPGQPVCAGGLHHCYSPVCGASQQLVAGRAVSGGQCHHSPGCCAGRLQLWHQRSG